MEVTTPTASLQKLQSPSCHHPTSKQEATRVCAALEHGCRWAALASSQQASASIAFWKSLRLNAACLLQVIAQHESSSHLYAEGKTLQKGYEALLKSSAVAFVFHHT